MLFKKYLEILQLPGKLKLESVLVTVESVVAKLRLVNVKDRNIGMSIIN